MREGESKWNSMNAYRSSGSGLETGQAGTRVYVKMIKEDIHEIKTSIKNYGHPWSRRKQQGKGRRPAADSH